MSFVINFIFTMAMVTFLPLELLASSVGGDENPYSSRAFVSPYSLDLSSVAALKTSIAELPSDLNPLYVQEVVRHRALKNKRYMGRARRIYPKMFSAVEVEVLPKVLETFDFKSKAAIIQSVESAQEQGFSLENIYALLRNATHMKEKWCVRAARAVPGVFSAEFLDDISEFLDTISEFLGTIHESSHCSFQFYPYLSDNVNLGKWIFLECITFKSGFKQRYQKTKEVPYMYRRL